MTFVVDLSAFDACLFDLDGVITMTAQLHAMAWKRLFEHLTVHATRAGVPFVPFDIGSDHRTYVDGNGRTCGTAASRLTSS
jgi:beta-phosphoglucomutase-like phosphatase (HAD superfamily)